VLREPSSDAAAVAQIIAIAGGGSIAGHVCPCSKRSDLPWHHCTHEAADAGSFRARGGMGDVVPVGRERAPECLAGRSSIRRQTRCVPASMPLGATTACRSYWEGLRCHVCTVRQRRHWTQALGRASAPGDVAFLLWCPCGRRCRGLATDVYLYPTMRTKLPCKSQNMRSIATTPRSPPATALVAFSLHQSVRDAPASMWHGARGDRQNARAQPPLARSTSGSSSSVYPMLQLKQRPAGRQAARRGRGGGQQG
jgi:hypothetical protein